MENIAIGTRASGDVINKRQILNIAKDVAKANNLSSLKEFGGTLELTDRWDRVSLNFTECKKHKETTGKIEHRRNSSPNKNLRFKDWYLLLFLDMTFPLSWLKTWMKYLWAAFYFPGKYTLGFRVAKNAPIRGVDNKRQIKGTFSVTLDEQFLLIQLTYQGKPWCFLTRFDFLDTFSVILTKIHWSNIDQSMEFF